MFSDGLVFFRNYVYIITILDKSQITCLFFYFLIYLLVPKLSTHNFTAYNNTLDVLETTNKAQLSNQTDIDWKKARTHSALFGGLAMFDYCFPLTLAHHIDIESHTGEFD